MKYFLEDCSCYELVNDNPGCARHGIVGKIVRMAVVVGVVVVAALFIVVPFLAPVIDPVLGGVR